MKAPQDRIAMTVQEFTDYLTGVTTVTCHPGQEAVVRDALTAAATPKPYRVLPDQDCPEDRVFLLPPPRLPEWSP